MLFDTYAKVLWCPVYTNHFLGGRSLNRHSGPQSASLNPYYTKFDLFLDGSWEFNVSSQLQR